MTCLYLDPRRVYEYVDGQLTRRTRALVESHLAACPGCQETAAEFRALVAEVSGGLPVTANVADDPWADLTAARLEPDWLLLGLADASALRQAGRAAALIDGHFDRISSLTADEPHAAVVLGHVAMALDLGLGHVGAEAFRFSYADLVASLVRRFDQTPCPHRPIVDCLFLELTRGLVSLQAERYPAAIRHLTLARRLAPQVGDGLALAVACDALTRARSRQGKYERALRYVNHGSAVARRSGRQELAVVCDLRKAWILLQTEGTGSHAAVSLLTRADEALRATDDHVNCGNARAALAKVPAHKGLYFDGLRLYEQALVEYRQCDARHPNLARALVNKAQLKLLIAMRLAQPGVQASPGCDVAALRREALADLESARRIYERVRDVRGTGSVLVVTALLHLTAGECARAMLAASNAYDLGRHSRDRILMARARIQQCRAAHAAQSASGSGETPAYLALERARSFSEEAVELTGHMQHRRLIAAASIWKGLTLMHPYFGAVAEAAACRDVARAHLDAHTRDYIWDELQLLEQHLLERSSGERPAPSAAVEP